jgi:hypothetical protein
MLRSVGTQFSYELVAQFCSTETDSSSIITAESRSLLTQIVTIR